jgi:hypothetical protein
MQRIKAFSMAIVALLILSSTAAAESGAVPSYRQYLKTGDRGYKQLRDKDKLRNTCGAMCALIVRNHMVQGREDFTSTNALLVAAVGRVYNHCGKNPLSQYLSGEDIANKVMKNAWGWLNVRIRSTSYPSLYTYSKMIEDLNGGRPAIVNIRGGSAMSPKDPNGNPTNEAHFVVVFAADDNNVTVQDPWDGLLKTYSKKVFEASWVATKYAVVGKP